MNEFICKCATLSLKKRQADLEEQMVKKGSTTIKIKKVHVSWRNCRIKWELFTFNRFLFSPNTGVKKRVLCKHPQGEDYIMYFLLEGSTIS